MLTFNGFDLRQSQTIYIGARIKLDFLIVLRFTTRITSITCKWIIIRGRKNVRIATIRMMMIHMVHVIIRGLLFFHAVSITISAIVIEPIVLIDYIHTTAAASIEIGRRMNGVIRVRSVHKRMVVLDTARLVIWVYRVAVAGELLHRLASGYDSG